VVNLKFHVGIVKEHYQRRRLLELCATTAERIKRDGGNVEALVADLRERWTLLHDAEAERRADPVARPRGRGPIRLPGDVVRAVDPYTEADSVGVLVHLLVAFGNMVGRRPHFRVEFTRHGLNLFAVQVGGTGARGRKGQAWSSPGYLCRLADESWGKNCVKHGGLSSGDGLIYTVRDPNHKGEQIVDPGVEDKRLFVLESEFAQVLKVGTRDGNILSPIMRQAWDGAEVLAPLTKTCPTRATGAHISVVGHITKEELLRYLTEIETANGWANRFLWFAVQRSKFLPDGEPLPGDLVAPLVGRFTEAVTFGQTVQEIRRDAEATDLWRGVYRDLSEGRPGLVGAILGRAEAQTMRLACVYALLDRSFVIRKPHLLAALALWDYVEESVRYVSGDKVGDPVADQTLAATRQAGERGMSQTELHNLFGRNVKGERLNAALQSLVALGLIHPVKEPSAPGRPPTRWVAARYVTKKTNNTN
jgi:hypothetical protein